MFSRPEWIGQKKFIVLVCSQILFVFILVCKMVPEKLGA